MRNPRVRLAAVLTTILLSILPAETALAQHGGYVWQTFRTHTISRTSAPEAILEEEVQKVISAGHLAPFRFFFAERDSHEYRNKYYYWSNPGDVVSALSYAYPYVSSDLQGELDQYLRYEIVHYPPWEAGYLYTDEGARREYYRVPEIGHYRLGWWSCKESEHPWLQNLYGLWLYAYNTGDWQTVEDHWGQIRAFYEARKGNDVGFYAGIGGAIGYARMAEHLGQTADREDAANLVEAALGEGFADFDARAQDVLNSFTYHHGCRHGPGSGVLIFPVTYDLSPEVGRFLHDQKLGEVEESFGDMAYVNPIWHMTKGVNLNPVHDTEITFLPPNSSWGAFLAEAFVLQKSGPELAKHMGAPYTRVGDLYYIVKLASAIRARGATLWVDVRDGAPPESQGLSMSLPVGWHLLSCPYQLESDTVTDVLASLAGAYDLVYFYDASDPADPWKIHDVHAPIHANDLDRLPLGSAFWVHLTQPATWTLNGVPVSGHEIQLHQGFNMVGWPSETPVALPQALDSIAGKYEVVWGFDGSASEAPWLSYDPAGSPWANTLEQLVPGYGSWVYATEDCVLVLPE